MYKLTHNSGKQEIGDCEYEKNGEESHGIDPCNVSDMCGSANYGKSKFESNQREKSSKEQQKLC